MQHVDRPAQIQAFAEPVGVGRARADAKAVGVVTRPEDRDGISGACSGGRHLRERAAVGSPELERPVRPARDVETLFVYGTMMPAAEQREIGELRRAALRPVVEMMSLNDSHAAPGKAAGPVSMQERAA